jgi:hypothetical protein
MSHFLTTDSQLMCPHGGTVQASTANGKAKVGGAYIVRGSDTFTISQCTFMLGSSPHPCVRVQWMVQAQRNTAVSNPSLTDESVGMCVAGDGAPQGTVVVSSTQTKAKGL